MESKEYISSYSDMLIACKKAIQDVGFVLDDIDEGAGKIKAYTKTSILSWGEDITVTIEDIGYERIKVSVVSELKAQLMGWWVNERNEKAFIRTLSINLGQ